jgi:PAS domain S-box-containing protein
MTLRKKTLLIIGAILVSMIGILYAVQQHILLHSFADLERQDVEKNVGRAMNALSDDISGLVTMTNDWATWDDTYNFIEDDNEAYIEANPTNATMEGLRVNVMFFINSIGQIVFSKALDLQSGQEVSIPQSLLEHLNPDSILVRHPDTESSVSGIILVPEGPMLIASEPILTSQGEGPIRGALVWGRYLDSAEVDKLAETTRLSLNVHRLDEAKLPSDFEKARSALRGENLVFVMPLDKDFVAGYKLINDIYGEPSLILRANLPRSIYQQGQTSLLYFILLLVGAGFVFVIAILLILEKLVMSPLSRLGADVSRIGASGDLSARVSVKSEGELLNLAEEINGMLGRLEHSHKALCDSEEKFKRLVEDMNDGYFVVQDFKIVFANSRSAEMLGYAAAEVIGKPVSDFLRHDLAKELSKWHTMRLRGEDVPQQYEMALLKKDGTKCTVEFSARLIDYAGKPAVSVVMRDVTERKRMEEALERQAKELSHSNAELSSVNKELEAFSYSVSHDLRAPLRSIDGFSKALLEDYVDKLDAQGKDYLQRVRAASQRMAQLIDDLLNLSRVARSDMRREIVNLSVMAQEIASELQKSEPERRVEFVISEGLVANGDARLLRLVLENLFSNAWKFTGKHPSAKIEFGVETYDGRYAYFVRDDGAGFDMSYIDKLFTPFQRLHGVTEFPGTGIGLALVQRIIHRHGGRVWAEGQVEKGATFYFTLQ